MNWGPCKDISNVCGFLGMCGTCHVFIKDFVKLSRPLNDLLKANIPFEWGPVQEKSMEDLKDALINCPVIRPLDYTSDAPVTCNPWGRHLLEGSLFLDLSGRPRK